MEDLVVGEGFKPSRPVACISSVQISVSVLYPRDDKSCPRNQAGGFETLPYGSAQGTLDSDMAQRHGYFANALPDVRTPSRLYRDSERIFEHTGESRPQ